MMFKHMLRYLKNRKIKSFERRHFESERSKGYVIDAANDRSWYITFGKTIEEFAISPGGVLWMYGLKGEGLCRASLVHRIHQKRILIGDIRAYVENKGYGSIMMRNIIKVSRQIGAREITGNLTSTDSDHFDKLEYFYGKYGFIVQFSDNKQSGSISMIL